MAFHPELGWLEKKSHFSREMRNHSYSANNVPIFWRDFTSRARRQRTDEFRLVISPVQAFDLVGQDRTAYPQPRRNRDLKRIPLDLVGDRAEKGQANSGVVGPWRKNERRATIRPVRGLPEVSTRS